MRGQARSKWLMAAAVLALTATACGGDDDDDAAAGPEQQAGGSIRVDVGEPQFLIPGSSNESEGTQVLQTLYTGLYGYDDEVNLVPEIADGLPTTTDNQTWTIKIKSGWTFHNGEPVTAQSFVNAWNNTAYGPNAYNNNYFMDRIEGFADLQSVDPDGPEGDQEAPEPAAREMSGLRAVDTETIEIRLAAPFSQFPLLLGYKAFDPIADACLADLDACNEAPIGNGPYQMVGSWDHNVQIVVEKYADYKGAPGFVDEITFKIYDDLNTRYADFEAGELDIVRNIPPERVEVARTTLADRLIEVPTSSFQYLGYPLYDERFQDKRIRQAFSMAVDRQAIIDAIFPGRFQPAASVISPVVKGARPDPCEYCEYNPERARLLLDEAGGWTGAPAELWFNAGAGHEVWVQAVGDQLRQNLGVDYVLKGDLQFAEYLTLGTSGVDDDPETPGYTGPFRLSWGMDYPSPENYLKPLHGTQGTSNRTAYSNPEVDVLIAQGDEAADIDAGIPFYQQAEDLILEDMPFLPMWFSRSAVGYADTVTGVTVDLFAQVNLPAVSVAAQ